MRVDRPVTVLLLTFAIGCAPRTPAPSGTRPAAIAPRELAGTSWRLVSLEGAGVLEKPEATLEFPEAGKVAGRGSCNRFFGTVEVSGGSIRFGPLAATKMSCGDAADAQERRYLQALQAAERIEWNGDLLRIDSPGVEQPLRFVRR